MLKIKKCANCGQNSFKLLFDTQASVACENCGQVYNSLAFKRLPDDAEASRQIKISVQPNLIAIPHKG